MHRKLLTFTLVLSAMFLSLVSCERKQDEKLPTNTTALTHRAPLPLPKTSENWITLLSMNDGTDPHGTCLEPYSSGGFKEEPVWVHHSIDLSQFTGKTVRIRFLFDTRDGLFNKFEGWYLDNIKVRPLLGIAISPTNNDFEIDGSHLATGPNWHVTSRRSKTGHYSLVYQDDERGTYQAEPIYSDCRDTRNWGTVTLPAVYLAVDATLEFDTLWEVESVLPSRYDVMLVQIAIM